MLVNGTLKRLRLVHNYKCSNINNSSAAELLITKSNMICCRLENCSISKEGQALLQKFEVDITFIENIEQDRELRGTEVDSKETSIGRRSSF